jgi:hypothetical protein
MAKALNVAAEMAANEADPPKAIVVTWTENDWKERWPHRVEAMFNNSPIKKAPFITAMLKNAVSEYEQTGKIFEKPPQYRSKKKR